MREQKQEGPRVSLSNHTLSSIIEKKKIVWKDDEEGILMSTSGLPCACRSEHTHTPTLCTHAHKHTYKIEGWGYSSRVGSLLACAKP